MVKKIIRLTETELKGLLKDATIQILLEAQVNNGELNIQLPNSDFKLVPVENEEGFRQWAEPVWDILTASYENVGGLKSYRDFSDFCKKRHLFIMVFDQNNKILACATYRRIEGSRKMVAIGCEQSDDGKVALQMIIQDNIKNFNLRYWTEVSGTIEHYIKKHNGYPMPNILASDILNIDSSRIKLSNRDKVHYSREIGGNGEMFEKMIFGAKNGEIFAIALKEVEDYGSFMKEVNKMNGATSHHYTVKQAFYIIENIYRAHEEDGFNELIPSWHQGLIDSLDALNRATEKNQAILDYISYAEYLLSDMQLLELHPLDLSF